jgi:multidrug resistance protein
MSGAQKKDLAHLGEVVIASQVSSSTPDPRRTRNIILFLAACVALMMTGFGIIMPVFARRLGEFGNGVEALGIMTMSFALAQLVAAPVMGSLADRFGRRPMILLALAAFTLANIGYLLAPNATAFIIVRTLGGVFTAGLFPASMGIVADTVPEDRRARWIGLVMGGYGFGFIFGPALGGFLYDRWGFSAPFVSSAAMAFIALIAALFLVSETRPAPVRRRMVLRQRREAAIKTSVTTSIWDTLPSPLYLFGMLLLVDFITSFAFAFVEPQMIFYIYDELGWSTTSFGVLVGAYGLASVLGQTVLGQTSDRFGRKPVILLGLLLNAALYAGMAFGKTYGLVVITSIIAGLGSALISPALSAFYLDITTEQHRSRVVGIKESSLALGGVLGPLLVVVAARLMSAQGIFILAGVLIVGSAVLGLFILREPKRVEGTPGDTSWEISRQRSLAAQASLRGLVLQASSTRQHKSTGHILSSAP